MGRLYTRTHGNWIDARKRREKEWEERRDFKPPRRRWETPKELAAMSYKDFLKSQYWRENRYEFYKAAGFKFKRCGAKGVELHVHHKNYEHRGLEWLYPKDVIVLCKSCHEAEHGKDRKRSPL